MLDQGIALDFAIVHVADDFTRTDKEQSFSEKVTAVERILDADKKA